MMVQISALSAATWTYLFSISAGFVSLSTKQAGRGDLYKWFIFIYKGNILSFISLSLLPCLC